MKRISYKKLENRSKKSWTLFKKKEERNLTYEYKNKKAKYFSDTSSTR